MKRHLAILVWALALASAACGSSVDPGTGGGGGVMQTTTGAGGGDEVCGGFTGKGCTDDAYCDFPDGSCGSTDATGVCKPRPAGCSEGDHPTCGCDGKVYSSACAAASAGTDVNVLASCPAPTGTFHCGGQFCAIGAEYCLDETGAVGPVDTAFSCAQLPPLCGASASCACLNDQPCGFACDQGADGGLTLSCGDG
jgi:hypothetical protein